MPTSLRLKQSLAVFGLSLCAAFNLSAAETAPETAPATAQALSPVADLAMSQAELSQKLAEALNDASLFLSAKQDENSFNPTASVGLQSRIDNIKAIIEHGANPDVFVPGSLKLAPENPENLTPLNMAIVMAAAAQRPDLVETFIRKGANVRLRSASGYGAMDFAIYALLNAQRNPKIAAPSIVELDNTVRIVKALHAAGLRPTDATQLTGDSQVRTKNYATLGANSKTNSLMPVNEFVLRSLLNKHGLISDADFKADILGDRALAGPILSSRGITTDMLLDAGGNVVEEYDSARPGGSVALNVRKDTTLRIVAERFGDLMGTGNTDEAIAKLIAVNKLSLTREDAAKPQAEDLHILMPVSPKYQLGFTEADTAESLLDVAKRVKHIHYKGNQSNENIAADIARMNALPVGEIASKTLLGKGAELVIGYTNDNYAHYQPMTAPAGIDPGRKVDLFIVEHPDTLREMRGSSPHVKRTFSAAVNTNYAINRSVDMDRFHMLEDKLFRYPVGITPVTKILMNIENPELRDRVMFSMSAGEFIASRNADELKSYLTGDNIGFEGTRMLLDYTEKSKPIIFAAAGNTRITEGPYIQSHIGAQSPRSVLVGATGLYRTAGSGNMMRVIAPYSSYSADVCAPLPKQMGEQQEGTSFSDPLTAGLARQFNEWYGNRLSFEEIMAAGFMSADRDLLDYEDPLRVTKAMQSGTVLSANDLKTRKADFNSNGGGLPRNTFCGAGNINAARWKANLDTLLRLKRPGQDTEGKSYRLAATLAGTVNVNQSGKKEYIYRLSVPEDTTLGRLTFLLPQDRTARSEVVVKTPAGFEMQMPRALSDIVSTYAFAYEDVKKGDVIEIRTNQPLAKTAGLILRGQAPGNAIALLRDALRADGTLPAPLMQMTGNSVTGPSKPVTVLREDKPSSPGMN